VRTESFDLEYDPDMGFWKKSNEPLGFTKCGGTSSEKRISTME
jgi:hypothetical protein